MFRRSILSVAVATATAITSQISAAQDEKVVEEVLVTGFRQSLAQALDTRRNSDQIVDAVVAEDIGKFPDNNVIEALKRVPGVQIGATERGEGTAPVIRGDASVVTTVNGHEIFTASGRSASLQDIPATLLAGLEVYKTSDASLIEGGIGGTINIRTRRPFDFDGGLTTSVVAKGTYSDAAEKYNPNIAGLVSNTWDTSAGEFGALVNLSYLELDYREENIFGVELAPYSPITGKFADFYPEDPDREWDPGVELSNEAGATLNGVPYALARLAVGGWDRYGHNERFATNVSLQWRPNDSMEAYMDLQTQRLSNEGNMSFLFTRTDNFGANPDFTYYPGTNIVSEASSTGAFVLTSSQALDRETTSNQIMLGFDWNVNSELELTTSLVHQESEYSDIQPILDIVHTAPTQNWKNNVDDRIALDYGDHSIADYSAGWRGEALFDQWNEDEGSATSFKFDGKWTLNTPVVDRVEFGWRYSTHDSSESGVNSISRVPLDEDGDPVFIDVASIDGLLTRTPDGFFSDAEYPERWVTPSTDWLWNPSNLDIIRAEFRAPLGRPAADPTLAFKIQEDINALYAQAHYMFDFGSMTLDGLVGARYVSLSRSLNANNVVIEDGSEVVQPVSSDSDESEILPNASARLAITDDINVRLNYSETLSRPNFAQLNPGLTLRPGTATQERGAAESGNADLQPFTSRNIDLAFEWYFADDSAVTFTWFDRELDQTITSTTSEVDINGEPYAWTRPINAGESNYDGLELAVQYFPSNLPGILDGLGALVNYTILDGEIIEDEDSEPQPLVGLSETSYALSLLYERESFGIRISQVYRDDYLNTLNANPFGAMPIDAYSEGYGSTDLSANYNINDNFAITFDATNIFGDEYNDFFGDPSSYPYYNRDARIFSTTYSLGVRASF